MHLVRVTALFLLSLPIRAMQAQKPKTDMLALGQAQHGAKAAEAKLLFRKENPVQAALYQPAVGDSWKEQPNTKLVHFIRHGQGYHNLLGEVTRDFGATFSETGDYDLAVKENCPYLLPAILDPPLTSIGRDDAKRLKPFAGKTVHPELLVVSPMKRATQTVLIGFREFIQQNPMVPIVAHEDCREQFGVFTCDKRSDVEDYKEEFPAVNYDLLADSTDVLWQPKQRESMLEMAYRADRFLDWLYERPEKEIVVGTHSAWLMALYNVAMEVESSGSSESLKTFFRTGEMRSTLLTWRK